MMTFTVYGNGEMKTIWNKKLIAAEGLGLVIVSVLWMVICIQLQSGALFSFVGGVLVGGVYAGVVGLLWPLSRFE